jgi:hypothetical protein
MTQVTVFWNRSSVRITVILILWPGEWLNMTGEYGRGAMLALP